MEKMSLRAWIEAAIFAAMAMVLDFLPSIKIGPSISISFAMVPIFLVSFRWGMRTGLFAGFLWGMLQILMGDAYILTPLQGFIEYFLAFACIGLAGLMHPVIQKAIEKKQKRKMVMWVTIGVLLGSLIRYFWHFVAGVIFWGEYAKPGQTAVMYSLIANGTTLIATFFLCAFLLVILTSAGPRLLRI